MTSLLYASMLTMLSYTQHLVNAAIFWNCSMQIRQHLAGLAVPVYGALANNHSNRSTKAYTKVPWATFDGVPPAWHRTHQRRLCRDEFGLCVLLWGWLTGNGSASKAGCAPDAAAVWCTGVASVQLTKPSVSAIVGW